jgi:hypothetical protein
VPLWSAPWSQRPARRNQEAKVSRPSSFWAFCEVVILAGGVYAATVGNWIALLVALIAMVCLIAGTDWRDTR